MSGEQKRKEKEQEKNNRMKLKNEKIRLSALRKENTKLLDDDSDDAKEVGPNVCYACEHQFEQGASDWIACTKCVRKFHIACAENIDFVDNYFECKYC